ncbi:MAG: pyridoxal-phosphate-dependent aminotransferase family protein [Solirubrobacterales bacterium]
MSARAELFSKQYLMTAGPTPLPPAVSQVMAEPILYHRAPAFIPVLEDVLSGLRTVLQTANDVLIFASSGTGALESAMANLIRPGDPVLVHSAGKFGERWAEFAEAYGADLTHLQLEWGEKVDPARIGEAIAQMDSTPVAVFTTQSETSTGVANDIKAINEVVTAAGSMLCVDAVSGLGAANLPQDEWGVDIVVSGSQKALMTPPGLGYASVSDRALAQAAERPGGRYYFDWQRTAKGLRKDPPDTPFTPPVTLLAAQAVALGLMADEGLDGVFARHALLAEAARAGVGAIGLERFGPEDPDANVVTAARLPEGVDGAAVPKRMRESYGVTAAGGQGHLKGQIVRIAHCGYYGGFDILIALGALEMALRDLGHTGFEPGAAVGAAQKVFAEAGRTPEPVG